MSCRIAIDAGDAHNQSALSTDHEDEGECLERIDLSQSIETAVSSRVTAGHKLSILSARTTASTTTIPAPTRNDIPIATERPPPLDLEQLHTERTRGPIRRVSTRMRRLDDAPDSLRLESTRRRATATNLKEPSRATVVYSPRALATIRKEARRDQWQWGCRVM